MVMFWVYRVGQSNVPRSAINVTVILVHLIVRDSNVPLVNSKNVTGGQNAADLSNEI